MYTGKNPTALNSHKWLVDALLKLMESKPYSKVSIKDICNEADLSRQTFYKFFENKDDIIRFHIQECYKEMMETLSSCEQPSLNDVTKYMAEAFQNHHKFIKLIISQNLEYLLAEEIANLITVFAENINPSSPKTDRRYENAFLTGAIANTVICWFKDPCPPSADEIAKLLSEILAGNYYHIHNKSIFS